MAEINNFLTLPIPPSLDPSRQRPEQRGQQQDRTNPQNIQATQKSNKAPLNLLPSDETLERLVTRAQDAQNQGQTLARGSIVNLII